MAAIHSYLTFNGACEKAFNFYKSVFGGDFPSVMRFKDVPSEHPLPEGAKEQIMHMTLPIGKNSILMGSDSPEVFGGDPVVPGNNFSVAVVAESEEEARRSLVNAKDVDIPSRMMFDILQVDKEKWNGQDYDRG